MGKKTGIISETPLTENEQLKKLFAVMRDNKVNSDNLNAMVNYVASMERHLESAVNELVSMRRELADMREIQNHPIKTALQNAVKALESKINDARERLGEIKSGIIEGVKNALKAFNEKGPAALNNVMSFFHIKDGLKSMGELLDAGIKTDNRAIASIDSFSKHYHEAGKAFKNMGHVLIGKEQVVSAKPAGNLAKTLQAPYRAERAALTGAKRAVTAAITKLERLETTQAKVKADRATGKPSLLNRLEKNKIRAADKQQIRPVPKREKVQEQTV